MTDLQTLWNGVVTTSPMATGRSMRQRVLALWLDNSSLDAKVVAWSLWDGTGAEQPIPGDSDAAPYRTGFDALLDGWRLIQLAPIAAHPPGGEFTTSYLKYEFVFEQWVDAAEVSSDG